MATKGPDLSEFFALSRPKRRPCPLGFVFGTLDDAEAASLKAALDTDVSIITAAAVVDWLARRNHDVTFAAVTNHRKRRCSCND